MLMTQKFHSLNEIDPEFIAPLAELLHGVSPSFSAWRELEAQAPNDDTFTYWLFFGNTQNAPVGVAQVWLRKSDAHDKWPWWKKWRASKKWRIAQWGVAGMDSPPAIFMPRFAEAGQAKCLQLMREAEARPEVVGESMTLPEDWAVPSHPWEDVPFEERHGWRTLKPFERIQPNYEAYLATLAPATQKEIQQAWRRIHKEAKVSLGDFPTPQSREDLKRECPNADLTSLEGLTGGLLTFQKDGELLGYLHYRQGHAGTWFFEPSPLETQGSEVVSDQLYVQYALLKFFEMSTARRLVIQRNQRPVRLEQGSDEEFFIGQGFHVEARESILWGKIPLSL